MAYGLSLVRPVAVDTTALTSSNVAETETLWAVGTTYALDAAVYVVESGIHARYVSLQNSNLAKVPADEPTWWRYEGATNRWAMFDETASSLTTNAEAIVVAIQLPVTERADVLYLQGLEGRTVRVQVEDPTDGLVYDETVSLSDPGTITDPYAWLFDPVAYKTELLVPDLPNGAGSLITVRIANTGGTAACGNLVVGYRQVIGKTRWGVKTEIRDYSVFSEDDFGNRVLVPRAYRKIASAEILVENRIKDAVETLLAGCRASVRLYIFDEGYTTLAVLGTARWSNAMALPPLYSVNSIQAESIV